VTAPIRAFVGPNGSGKTLAAMALVVAPALRQGRQVVSTCRIHHPNARLLQSWREIDKLRANELLLDEITSQLPSRQAMSLPPQLQRTMNQLRKVDVGVSWTAPSWARADVLLREVTMEVTVCRSWVADRWEREPGVPPVWRLWGKRARDASGRPRRVRGRWSRNSLFRWQTYDATAFDEFTYHRIKKVKPASTVWYWRPWQPECQLYDTLDAVELLDHLDDVGICAVCGGMRRRPACTCGNGKSGRTPGSPKGEASAGSPTPLVPVRRPDSPILGGKSTPSW